MGEGHRRTTPTTTTSTTAGSKAATTTRRRRKRVALLVAIFAASFGAVACGPIDATPPPPGCPTAPPDAVTSTIVNRINGERTARGLNGLFWNARLACLAQEWSQFLLDSRQFFHRDLVSVIRSPGFEGYTRLGETILVSPASVDGNAMFGAWMRSPSHAAELMGDYDTVGVGIARRADGTLKAVANFGRH